MKKIEYEVFEIEHKTTAIGERTIRWIELKKMNELGIEGGDLVTIIDSHKDGSTDSVFLLFKREI